MPTETEELRLVVNLTDNASAGVIKLRQELQALGTGASKQHVETFKRDTQDMSRLIKGMGLEVGNTFKEIGKFGLGVSALGLGLTSLISTLTSTAEKIQSLNQAARAMGVDKTSVENIVKQYEDVGVSSEKTLRNLQGMSTAIADTMRPGSQLRRELLDMAGNSDRAKDAMADLLQKMQNAGSAEEQLNYALQALQNTRTNAFKQYHSDQEAALRTQELAKRLGLDMSALELDHIKEMTAAERQAAAARLAGLEATSKELNKIYRQWEDIKQILIQPLLDPFIQALKTTQQEINGIIDAFKWIEEHVFGKQEKGKESGDTLGRATKWLRERLLLPYGGGPLPAAPMSYAPAAGGGGPYAGLLQPAAYTPGAQYGGGGYGGYGTGGGYGANPMGYGAAGGGGSSGGSADGRGYGKPTPSGSDTGGMDASVPSDILSRAKQVALQGGPVAVEQFMQQQGYPKRGAWCGEFAASVVKSVGGTPPKGAAIASNWRNWGEAVDTPQPGDIAVRRGAATGATGSHVTIVGDVNAETGRFTGIGGNQGGRARASNYAIGRFEFRRATGQLPDGQTAGPGSGAGAGDTPANTSGPLTAGSGGRVSPSALEGRLGELIGGSGLEGYVPRDAARYGIKTGSKEEWANLMTQMAGKESGFKSGTVGDVGKFGSGSRGLFQLSGQDAVTYGIRDTPFTDKELADPDFNARMAVVIAEKRARAGGIGGQKGMAAYWAGQKGYLARGQVAVDRSQIDRSASQVAKVEGTGKLSVDVKAPPGAKVDAEGGGLFKQTEINRQTQMEPARRGPAPAAETVSL